jgi:Ca-activated chloride channel family protein
MMHGYDLATPLALLLLPLPLLVALWRRRGAGVAAGLRISTALRDRMVGEVSAVRPASRGVALRWLAWVLIVVALADPRKVAATPALPATGRDIIFTLDLSGSMVAEDMLAGGKPITRIALLKKVGTELIRRRAGDRIGLVIFAERALAAAPLSFDADGVARTLNHVEIGLVGRSTAMGDGLGLAVKRLSESKAPSRVVILLSDGSNNAGSMDPAGVASLARGMGIKIYTIGFGPNETTTPNDDPDSVDYVALQNYARIGGGEAFRVRNGEDFNDAGRKIEALLAGETLAPPAVLHEDLWPWPAGFAMVGAFAMAIARRRPL